MPFPVFLRLPFHVHWFPDFFTEHLLSRSHAYLVCPSPGGRFPPLIVQSKLSRPTLASFSLVATLPFAVSSQSSEAETSHLPAFQVSQPPDPDETPGLFFSVDYLSLFKFLIFLPKICPCVVFPILGHDPTALVGDTCHPRIFCFTGHILLLVDLPLDCRQQQQQQQ